MAAAAPPPPAPTDAGPAFARRAALAGAEGVIAQPVAGRSPFTPTRPVRSGAALFGRRKQLDRAIAAIELERAHLAIFGERGHGKTSLANVVAGLAEAGGYGVVRHACSAGAGFSDLIGAILDKTPPRFLRRAVAEPALAQGAPIAAPPLPDWTVAEATAVLERIRTGHVLVFVDEFDRLRDAHAKRDMTELLKNISDLNLRVSFVLIGVADSLEELLALHQSIHRSLVAIPVPLLTEDDLIVLIRQGCDSLGLRLDPAALTTLLLLAHNSPYYAQLLSLHATDTTQRRGGDTVTPPDVTAAAMLVLEETRQTFDTLLAHLPQPAAAWNDFLYAAARAPCDGFGWFAAADVAATPPQPYAEIAAALERLTQPEAGPILRARRTGERTEFIFARANLRNHVVLRLAHRGGVI